MPITLLFKKENSPGFRESYIHVEWGPRHQLFSSKHTHKHCLLACARTVLHAHMQMHAWPDNIAVAGDIYVCSMRIHQCRHHLFLSSFSLSSPLRQDGRNDNLFKCDIYTSCFVLLFEPENIKCIINGFGKKSWKCQCFKLYSAAVRYHHSDESWY